MATLIVQGPGGSAKYVLQAAKYTLGRSAEADIPIKDVKVSPVQFALIRTPSGYALKHMAAQGRTLVNGAPVTEHLLRNGDLIQVGDTRMRFQDGAAEKTAAAPAASGQSTGRAARATRPITTRVPAAGSGKETAAVKPGTRCIPATGAARPGTSKITRPTTAAPRPGTTKVAAPSTATPRPDTSKVVRASATGTARPATSGTPARGTPTTKASRRVPTERARTASGTGRRQRRSQVNTAVLFGLLILLGAIFSLILYALGGGFAPSKEGLEATARAALAKARTSAQAGDFDQALEMCQTALEAAGKAGIASLEGEAQTLMRDAEQLRSQLKQIETRVSDLLGRTVDENDSAALARWLEEAEAVLRDTQNPRFTEAQLARIARLAEFRQILTGRQLKVRGEEERIQQVHARRAEAQQKKEAGEIAQAVRVLEEALRLAQDARNEYLRNQIQRDIEFWRGEEAQNLAQRVIDEAKGIKRREGNAAARRYVEAQMPRFKGTAGQQRLQRYIEENLSEGR